MAVNSLEKYYDTRTLNFAWNTYRDIKLSFTGNEVALDVPKHTRIGTLLAGEKTVAQAEAVMFIKCLGLFMKNGPIIVRPSLDMCKCMLDTEINFELKDYHQPYSIMGIELPSEISTSHKQKLLLVWQIDADHLFIQANVDIPGKSEYGSYHQLFIAPDGLLEEQLTRPDMFGDNSSERIKHIHRASRIGINLCQLSSQRQIRTTKLSKAGGRHRRANDRNLNELGAREFQEVVFRDLFITERPHDPIDRFPEGTGPEQQKQQRRGHWKWVAYGPKHSLRRWQHVNEYWTKPDKDKNATVILS